MPEPSPAAQPPAPTAPGIAQLVEMALQALGRAPAVFAAAALRPAPAMRAVAGVALASGAAALAVNLTHATVVNPDFLQRFPPLMVLVVAAAAFGLYTSLLLMLAVLLYGLGRALSGEADFDRAIQTVACLSLFAPLQAVCNWFAVVWALPALLAAWVAAGALEGFFKVKPVSARTACALGASAAIAFQLGGRLLLERTSQAYAVSRAITTAAQANEDISRRIQSLQLPDQTQSAAAPSPTATSGLDLLRAPEGESQQAAAPTPATTAETLKDPAKLEEQAANMLGTLTPMLDNPATTRNLSPQQKADLKDLQKMMKDLQAQMRPGAPRLTPAEQAKQMQHIQEMTMRMMSAGMRITPQSKPTQKETAR